MNVTPTLLGYWLLAFSRIIHVSNKGLIEYPIGANIQNTNQNTNMTVWKMHKWNKKKSCLVYLHPSLANHQMMRMKESMKRYLFISHPYLVDC